MIHHEAWYREALEKDMELTRVVASLVSKLNNSGEVSEDTWARFLTLSARVGNLANVLSLFPPDFPIYITPEDSGKFHQLVDRKVHESFSDIAFENFYNLSLGLTSVDTSSGNGLLVREEYDKNSETVGVEAKIEIKGTLDAEIEYDRNEYDDDGEDADISGQELERLYPILRDRFEESVSAASNWVGGMDKDSIDIVDNNLIEGLTEPFAYEFTASFYMKLDIDVTPEDWKFVIEA